MTLLMCPFRALVDDHILPHVTLRSALAGVSWPRPKLALGLVPIVQWLPQYSIRASGVSDLIAGLTVGVLMIPQGLHSLESSYFE